MLNRLLTVVWWLGFVSLFVAILAGAIDIKAGNACAAGRPILMCDGNATALLVSFVMVGVWLACWAACFVVGGRFWSPPGDNR